ncbi:fungal specific transcription factor [Purpureocillium lavendulum]|uniref:Fungal specific transcription factor n=1 Tax=Purpureocillium lavendulum TaxID=1247861 RepID=A0AB34FFB0_9HYPO|nr:fungal specific transcription factor [Purpureocillium lavendulum]
MSVAYEPRNFIHEGAYPSIGEDHDHDDDHCADQRFTDSDVAEHLGHYTADTSLLADDGDVLDDRGVLVDDRGALGDDRGILADDGSVQDASRLDLGPTGFSSPIQVSLTAPPMAEALSEGKDTSPGAGSPSSINRVKAVPKPDREVAKGPDGRFHCTISDCKEELRSFTRKCEWNKHMDKHERPYRCPADGCENLPGFTYSGGLLRHEREVHGKHGGPKNTVNCPHPNCKRHTGKGFSRQENLNEHLRRVHTNMEESTPPAVDSAAASPQDDESEKSGTKRKRRMSDQGEDLTELRDEVTRLREENEKLRKEVAQQSQDSLAMMAQIGELQAALRHGIGQHGLGAPTAQMI